MFEEVEVDSNPVDVAWGGEDVPETAGVVA